MTAWEAVALPLGDARMCWMNDSTAISGRPLRKADARQPESSSEEIGWRAHLGRRKTSFLVRRPACELICSRQRPATSLPPQACIPARCACYAFRSPEQPSGRSTHEHVQTKASSGSAEKSEETSRKDISSCHERKACRKAAACTNPRACRLPCSSCLCLGAHEPQGGQSI